MEGTIEPETSRTESWVNKGQSTNMNTNGGVKAEVSKKDDENAKPPDYDQSVG